MKNTELRVLSLARSPGQERTKEGKRCSPQDTETAAQTENKTFAVAAAGNR